MTLGEWRKQLEKAKKFEEAFKDLPDDTFLIPDNFDFFARGMVITKRVFGDSYLKISCQTGETNKI
jgi:hypothetical protein